jgi:hypothetical protein
MFKNFLILLLLVSSSPHAFAQSKAFALIRKIQGVEELPSNVSRQLEKLTLQVVAKQPDYELLLSGNDTPTGSVVDMVAVESEVGRTKDQYRIETRLLDLKTKKLIRKASRDNIREEDLIRLFQGALESLFIADEKNPKAQEQKPETKVPPIVPPNQQPKTTTTQTNAPDNKSLDFRQRVLALQAGVDGEIAKTLEEKEQAQAGATKEAPKEQSPVMNVAATANASVAEVPFKKPVFGKNYEKKHTLFFGYDTRQNESAYRIATSTKASLLTLKAQGHFPTSFLDGKTAYSYDFAYSKIMSSPLPFAAPYQLGVYGTLLTDSYIGSFGLLRDSSFFANVSSPGAGLTAQNITATWFRLKNEFRFDVKGLWKIGINYGMPFQVETNYSPLKSAKKWSGNSMQFVITPPMAIKEWESALTFEKLVLSTQGDEQFTLNETRFGFYVRRSL